MKTVNRALLVVSPKGPYVAWANANNDEDTPVSLEHFAQERTAFLVGEVDDADYEEGTLQECYARIFEYELAEWSRDPGCWPQQRDLKTFREWFEVEVCTVVVDTASTALHHDE